MDLFKYKTLIWVIFVFLIVQLCVLYKARPSETSSIVTRSDAILVERTRGSRQNRSSVASVLRRRLQLRQKPNDDFVNLTINKQCFKSGINKQLSVDHCICLQDYYGDDCGIPAPVWFSFYNNSQNRQEFPLTPRKLQRRVIQGLNINHELDLLHIRFQELGDLIDAYIICESNYTAHGDPKNLTLPAALESNLLKGYVDKIVYVIADTFPEKSKTDGWHADSFLRRVMAKEGLPLVSRQEDDDLFLMFDADEIPVATVVKFLKLYDGYPETITFVLRWSVFNFYWQRKRSDQPGIDEVDTTHIPAGTTIGMLREVYSNDVMSLRRPQWTQSLFSRYIVYRTKGKIVADFSVGTLTIPAGWHCSWCYSPEGILTKMVSAHSLDTPRWGDFRQKLSLTYIKSLAVNGEWFDGSKPFVPSDTKDPYYAPQYVIKNYLRYLDMMYP